MRTWHILLITVLCIGLSAYLPYWAYQADRAEAQKNYEQAQELIEQAKQGKAICLTQRVKHPPYINIDFKKENRHENN